MASYGHVEFLFRRMLPKVERVDITFSWALAVGEKRCMAPTRGCENDIQYRCRRRHSKGKNPQAAQQSLDPRSGHHRCHHRLAAPFAAETTELLVTLPILGLTSRLFLSRFFQKRINLWTF